MQTDQLKKHLQLFTEGTAVPDDDLPDSAAPAPAAAPATATGFPSGPELEKRVQLDVNGKKIAPITAQEEQLIRDLLERMDIVLKQYRDKDGKTFESASFESINESEQRQYIMQNLHLLSEADQMVVLRSIMNEGPKTDALKYGIEKIATPLVKGLYNAGKKGIDVAYNDVVKPYVLNPLATIIGGAASGIGTSVRWGTVATAAGLGATAVFDGGLSKLYRYIVPADPLIDKELTLEDYQEMKRIEQDWYDSTVMPTEYLVKRGIKIGFSQELQGDMFEMKQRWERFRQALIDKNRTPAAPAKTEPGYTDKALDTVKGLFK